MDVFRIRDSEDVRKITITNFEEATQKMYPYYQVNNNGKQKLYAVCPACGNTIQIINLYGIQQVQNITNVATTYGRHCNRNIAGFDPIDINRKENCDLYRPTPLGNREIMHNDQTSIELKQLIENNRDAIKKDIRKILSINLSHNILDRVIDSFIESQSYSYRAVTKYNLPYSIIYYSEAINLYSQYLLEEGRLFNNIKISFSSSRYFIISEENKITKNTNKYAEVYFNFLSYRRLNDRDFVRYKIFESEADNEYNTIFEDEIEIELIIYNE
ncbi:hypothetical protein GKC56_05095 [Neisseriaceae bacterium PsAf]|nr:hypothetical protein [Neisseriaceae bacterium PsAf]